MSALAMRGADDAKLPFAEYARAPFDHEYACSTWFERDRKMVSLETPNGREVFTLWDEAVDDAVESGYLSVPQHPRPSDKDWLPCAVGYAYAMGLLKTPAQRAEARKRRALRRADRYWAQRVAQGRCE